MRCRDSRRMKWLVALKGVPSTPTVKKGDDGRAWTQWGSRIDSGTLPGKQFSGEDERGSMAKNRKPGPPVTDFLYGERRGVACMDDREGGESRTARVPRSLFYIPWKACNAYSKHTFLLMQFFNSPFTPELAVGQGIPFTKVLLLWEKCRPLWGMNDACVFNKWKLYLRNGLTVCTVQ